MAHWNRIDWSKVEGLGKRSDQEIARELGVDPRHVARKRVELAGVVRPSGTPARDWHAVGIGKRTDADIARELGVSRQTVEQARRRMGLMPVQLRRVVLDVLPAAVATLAKLHPKLPANRALARVLEDVAAELERSKAAKRRKVR